jgi:hypothetical protein
MTRLISALLILAVVFVGYRIYVHWEKIQSDNDKQQRAETAVASVSPESLPGLPPHLDQSLHAAREKGPAAFRAWYNASERLLADPRKAWIELDLCVAITRDDPAAAKRIFAGVKARVPPSSPVWPRVKELEKAYD